MKKMVKKFFHEYWGKELLENFYRWRKYRKHYRSGHFARSDIDKLLGRLLPHSKGFYVELGANGWGIGLKQLLL